MQVRGASRPHAPPALPPVTTPGGGPDYLAHGATGRIVTGRQDVTKTGPRGFPRCQGCQAEATGPKARWCVRCWTPERDPVGAATARRLGLLPPLQLSGAQLELIKAT